MLSWIPKLEAERHGHSPKNHENMKTKIDIIDDHHIVRGGLSSLLSSVDEYEILHEAGNGKEYLACIKDGNLPDIAIVDLQMPIMDGYDTILELTKSYPSIKTLALTVDPSEESMIRALKNGARGFIRKNAAPTALKHAINSIVTTGYFFNEETHKLYTANPSLKTKSEVKRDEIIDRITAREKEFLILVCDDAELTYDQIADRMGITSRTVDYYRNELFEKFEIKSKAGLVLFGIKWGLLEA